MSIFKTPEFECISRDFNYTEYLRICTYEDTKPFCEFAYNKLKEAFNIQLEFDIGRT